METRKIVTHIFSDDELADFWSKHLGVQMGALRAVNADALRAMRAVEQMIITCIREADTASGITDAELREILAQCAERRGWPNTAKNVRDDNIFSGMIEIGNVFAAMRAVASRTRPSTPAPDAMAQAVEIMRPLAKLYEERNELCWPGRDRDDPLEDDDSAECAVHLGDMRHAAAFIARHTGEK